MRPLIEQSHEARLANGSHRRALLICNGSFDDPELPTVMGVAKDHERLDAAFRDARANFEVTSLLDAGFLEVRKAVAQICEDSSDGDTILIYYSGFSFKAADGSLFLPVRDSSKRFADATTLDTDFILRHLRQSRCKRNILIVDGCHAGAFFVNNRGIPDGLYAIMACGADEQTADTRDGGAFSCALVQALDDPKTDRDGDGRISIDELYESVKVKLALERYNSTPQKWIWNVRESIHVATVSPTVFLSYARRDVDQATVLKNELEKRGFSVWMDLEGIPAGNYKEKVTNGLNRSRCVVFLMTGASLKSASVQKELEFASGRGIPLLPVSDRPWPDNSLPDWYRFDYGPVHRRVIGSDATSLDELAVAIRTTRPGDSVP